MKVNNKEEFDKQNIFGMGEANTNVINLIKNCVYNQQNILKNSVFLKKFCFFL